jgi:carbon monoxide dehydrogenase subunit G
MDTEAIASCVPAAALEPLGGDRCQAKLVATVAAIRIHRGTVAMLDKVAPDPSGGHRRGGQTRLRERGIAHHLREGRRRSWTSPAMEVGGMIARMGQRLIGSVSKMMLDRFFACMARKVRGRGSGLGTGAVRCPRASRYTRAHVCALPSPLRQSRSPCRHLRPDPANVAAVPSGVSKPVCGRWSPGGAISISTGLGAGNASDHRDHLRSLGVQVVGTAVVGVLRRPGAS